ncbi:putative membrane protein [Sphingobacterium alimentarium]|uniref:Putative membrane protein n=2 Tax=Sphingobacterium alimentarium TaxID=797292 RepID=A0A4R3W0L3_9SPHI|nr:putative membrane protein [Sphingobacterium alimentarium]
MTEEEKKYKGIIWVLSIVIPLAVAALFGVNLRKLGYDVEPLSFLPPIYATINGLTAVFLVAAVYFIKRGNAKLHENLIKLCMACSSLFLLMYVAYHMTSDSTPYGGEGVIRYVYFFILISHIILSVIIIPFVLFTFVRGIAGAYERHKKLARITYPMWLYVAVTGVIVYLMISPYYNH